MPSAIACLGAVHADLIAHGERAVLRETSTPGTIRMTPGGVATNVARALARLAVPVRLAGAIGQDADGTALARQLAEEGLDVGALARTSLATGRYLALHDPDGSLAGAICDTAITESLDEEFVAAVAPLLAAAPVWFCETNLPEAALAALAEAAGERMLVADAVSRAKAPKLAVLSGRLDLVFLNRAEAAAWTGFAEETPAVPLALAVAALGPRRVVLSDGGAPLTLVENGEPFQLEPPAAQVVDVTGAGDALIAGTLAGLARSLSLEDAAIAGLRAARLTLEATGAVAAGLSWPAIAPAGTGTGTGTGAGAGDCAGSGPDTAGHPDEALDDEPETDSDVFLLAPDAPTGRD
ncbi:PfkB family carbohydrate kinase [Pannonibacter tanglangensis]|uniref:Kinase n=1 Tax=Pannonibacter tanglangensis TaxID=2750084 RepID=A0ABW9ZFD6_9HYPH|nr:PfkB family carbohydrate kinase [Pannonibacter sp. XCT-34]NBN63560.1 kinase [Pannonibacter sp. XCT-34]